MLALWLWKCCCAWLLALVLPLGPTEEADMFLIVGTSLVENELWSLGGAAMADIPWLEFPLPELSGEFSVMYLRSSE